MDAIDAHLRRCPDEHLRAQSRVYGPETWAVYERLDRSLEPRGPELMDELAFEHLHRGSRLLDAGCGDGRHLLQLLRATTETTAVGVEPVTRLVEEARRGVAGAGLDERAEIVLGVIDDLPFPDGHFDLVWCRDVLEVVAPLEESVAELARVLRPGGHALVYTVFATERLELLETGMLRRHLSAIYANLDEVRVEAAFAAAGLAVIRKDVIGTEWREHAEERERPASQALLRLARLRRQRDEIVESVGEDLYDHVEANLHWLVFQFLGKLQPTLYDLGVAPETG